MVRSDLEAPVEINRARGRGALGTIGKSLPRRGRRAARGTGEGTPGVSKRKGVAKRTERGPAADGAADGYANHAVEGAVEGAADGTFVHAPVLLGEVLAALVPGDGSPTLPPHGSTGRGGSVDAKDDGAGEVKTVYDAPREWTLVDCTLGGAGHASALVRGAFDRGVRSVTLYGFDRDATARDAASARLGTLAAAIAAAPPVPGAVFHWEIVPSNFAGAGELLLGRLGRYGVDALLADFGVSSPQLDVAARGFSLQKEGPLDMRMDASHALTARRVLEEYDEVGLARILRDYGEEPRARKLASAIVADRATGRLPLSNTVAFAEYAARVLGYHGSRVHPATRVFQALRIEVNGELEAIDSLLDSVPALLKGGGRAGFISFHSLEDARVKRRMRAWQKGEARPGRERDDDGRRHAFPWIEDRTWGAEVPRGGLATSETEARTNPRARSARLRVFRFGQEASRGDQGEGEGLAGRR